MTLEEVQKDLAEYDKTYWLQEPGFDTIRHVSHHLGKLIGKVSTYCEAVEDKREADASMIDNEVIADLVMYAARIASDRGISLDEAYARRKQGLLARHNKNSATAIS